MVLDENHFYSNIPNTQKSIIETLRDDDAFFVLPASWDILVTDIAGSTRAVQDGKYREVNLVAVSCLVSALNLARDMHIQIPFFFGGDGATILCPSTLTRELMNALKRIQNNAQKNFSLTLRVGSVNAHQIFESGGIIKIAKVLVAPGYHQAMVIGDGLDLAEKMIKNDSTVPDTQSPSSKENPPLQGLECRWREIASPTLGGEIVSLIISSSHPSKQAALYANVLELIESIYGNHEMRHPVRKEHLNIISTFAEIKKELMIKYETPSWFTMCKTVLDVLIASLLFKFNLATRLFDPRVYKQQLIAATDSLKIDGMFKTTIQGSMEQRTQLIDALDSLEKEGKLLYGLYATDATVMTCYVGNRNSGHVHFLDAKNGGYTQAATIWKQKKQKLQNH